MMCFLFLLLALFLSYIFQKELSSIKNKNKAVHTERLLNSNRTYVPRVIRGVITPIRPSTQMSNFFEQAASAKKNRLSDKGGWSCCRRSGLNAPGCKRRAVHKRSGRIFCHGCGDFFTLDKNLSSTLTKTITCSRHAGTVQLVETEMHPGIEGLVPPRLGKLQANYVWQCCGAIGVEASVISDSKDLESGYSWGCVRGRHCGVPDEVDEESEEEEEEESGDEGVAKKKSAKQEEEEEGKEKKKKRIKRPEQWYAIEINEDMLRSSKRRRKITPSVLFTSILGVEMPDHPHDDVERCLYTRKKFWPILDDIISSFDRLLTIISVFNIVYFTLNIFRSSIDCPVERCRTNIKSCSSVC